MTTVPVAEARQNFSALVDEAVTTHQRIQVTRNGVPVIWMISDDDFESIMETIDVLTDGAALRDIEQSRADEEAGRYFTADEMDVIMAARREGLDIGGDVDVVAEMHAHRLPDSVCMDALNAIVDAHRSATGDLSGHPAAGCPACPSIDAREGRDGVLGIHSRAARGESVARRKAAA
jgi:prevent-host-death family protein